MANAEYEIIKELGVISERDSGWSKQLNLISWNGSDQILMQSCHHGTSSAGKMVFMQRSQEFLLARPRYFQLFITDEQYVSLDPGDGAQVD